MAWNLKKTTQKYYKSIIYRNDLIFIIHVLFSDANESMTIF
jgi:hypothetical protein